MGGYAIPGIIVFFFWLVVIILAIILLAFIVHWAGGGQLDLRLGHFDPRRRLHLIDNEAAVPYYRTSSPVTARPMISRWISEVPSKMVKIFASRCQRSTGNSRV